MLGNDMQHCRTALSEGHGRSHVEDKQLFLDISPLLFRIAEPLHILLKQFFQLKQNRSAVTMADNGQPAEILRRGFRIKPCLSAVF